MFLQLLKRFQLLNSGHRSLDAFLWLSVVTLLCYGHTLHYEFHFDDYRFIVKRPLTQNFYQAVHNIHREEPYFSAARLYIQNIVDSLFSKFPNRDLPKVSFALNYVVGEKSQFEGYHFVNILLHLLNGYLVFYLLSYLGKFRHQTLALVISVIYISHPIQTASVTYILQRNGLFAAFFSLLCIIHYLKFRHTRSQKMLGVAIISLWLALHCKEIALMTLPIIFTMEILFERYRPGYRHWLFRHSIWLLVLFAIMALYVGSQSRFWSEGSHSVGFNSKWLASPVEHFLSAVRVFVHYWRLLLFPFPGSLNMDWDISISKQLGEAEGLSLVFHGWMLIIGLWLAKKKQHLMSFGIAWFYLALLPYLVVPERDILVEYKLYFPSIGLMLFCYGMCLWGTRTVFYERNIKNVRIMMGVLALCLIAFFVLGTLERNQIFEKDLYFWEDVVKKSPEKARAWHNLAVSYHYQKQYSEAVRSFLKTIELEPKHLIAHKNLGSSYEQQGDLEWAIYWYDRALILKPDFVDAHLGLGNSYAKQREFKKAINSYQKVVGMDPSRVQVYRKLGELYLQIKQPKKAIKYFRLFLQINPDDGYILERLTRLEKGLINKEKLKSRSL